MKKNIIVITPIKYLKNVYEKNSKYGNIIIPNIDGMSIERQTKTYMRVVKKFI